MKIVQLIYSLSSGGAERLVVDLSNELVKQNHEVYLIVFYNKLKSKQDPLFFKPLLDERIKYINLNVKEGFRLSVLIKIIKTILQVKPDVVHAHLNVIPHIFPLILFNKKTKYYHTLHSSAQRTAGSTLQKMVNRFFYRTLLLQPIVLSELSNESYRTFYQLNNAIIIKNGRAPVLKSEFFKDVEFEILSLKKSFSDYVFIHVSRYNKVKNQELLIRSFNTIATDGGNFILLIIGNAFETYPGNQLKEIACDRIFFIGEKKNVGDYFLCSDAFCLSSNDEGLPISLIEALSAGCVPICTAVGGIPNVIEDGENGYLSDSITVESYCNAIKRFMTNPDAISKTVLQEYFSRNFSIKLTAKKYIDLFTTNTNYDVFY